MSDLALVMPMAGRGSRFALSGEVVPKPLIKIGGQCFFHWAAESVLRRVPVRQKVFVVLEEHVERHGIADRIRASYPDATVLAISEPTAGAAETAMIGIAALDEDGPIAINDCDHAFSVPALDSLVDQVAQGAAGALVGFASRNPAYSYAQLADDDPLRVTGTIEKQCAGPYAIAGCYFFRNKSILEEAFARYRAECPYPELFLSGLYNLLCSDGHMVRFHPLEQHLSFGTPQERADLSDVALHELFGPAPCR